jgi:ribonuclease R
VAIFLRDREIPFPYRIHEPPDPADVDELNDFLAPFGLRLDYDVEVEPADAQRLLRALAPHPLARVLSRQVLRSLKQACYSTRNAGHFGLAFAVYCHFTSPIRRRPDLLVHRQLARVLDDHVDEARADAAALEDASIESSAAERRAVDAERAMVDLKKAEFMRAHLGEPGPGTIVSVVEFGLFVELDAYPVEGLVRVETLDDDHYRFVEKERALVGSGGRRRFRLGDRVLVEATSVSMRRGQVDLALLGRADEPSPAAPRGVARAKKRATRPSDRRARPPRRGRGGRRP